MTRERIWEHPALADKLAAKRAVELAIMSFTKPSGQCKRGKVKYATEAEAIHSIARSRRWAAGMTAYRCGPCQAWHIGHVGGQGQARTRR